MSHVAAIELQILDLDALEQACGELGLELRREQKTFKWYGRWVNDYNEQDAAYLKLGMKPEDYGKCDHAIAVKGNAGAYEAGLIKVPGKPGWSVIFDFFGGSGQALANCLGGQSADKLKQTYAAHAATRAALKQGFRVQKSIKADGTVQLLMVK